ncbi:MULTISPECIES: hypothetical protein [pseudomallei group]|uniref:Gp47 n=1 Tax=Burkholderia phage phiE255 TaxID=2883942 RepID=A4JWN9_9CAUD|nr:MULTISPECIES: hypothetical protein [pseudomallei group]YP_001111247.1 membrane protein [Burkholderia phage phiE255]ABO60673.1 gp47 [Burkholderia phage phiE255]AIS95103.1 putative phage membrane protein [Burkholderia thailandensis MSMB59]AOJ44325.1 hypothetical protein WJ27_03925 [Burkholderia thailandensis]KGS44775.1 putative phage membrane protein [Burkholderia pseudomallei MSHR5492]KVG08341.1 hypothetical protein WJ25_15025 [Burkholderia thailandensis]
MTNESNGKQEFNRSVGQAIQAGEASIVDRSVSIRAGSIGNVAGRDIVNVNHGVPISNSNVVNLQFGAKEAEVEFVTNHQKAVIMELVGQIADATETDVLKISRAVLARAGAKRIKWIRSDRYLDVEQYLSSWLNRVAIKQATPNETQPESIRPAPVESRSVDFSPQLHLAQTQLASTRTTLKITLFAALAGVAVLGYYGWTSHQTIGQLQAAFGGCQYAGKTYAVGAIIDNPDAPDIECVVTSDGKPGVWRDLTARRKR